MASDDVVVTTAEDEVEIGRPVETALRLGAGAIALVALGMAAATAAVARPSLIGFADAGLVFACAAATTGGLVCLAFALWGGRWVVVFEAKTGSVRRELRAFGNLVILDGFAFDDLGGLCAVRDDDATGAWHLYLVEIGDGRPLHLADFGDERAMRTAAGAIAGIHPGLRFG